MPDMDRGAFGSALARHRRASGLTGRQLASKVGEILGSPVLPQSISGWETGHNVPGRAKVEALEEALGVEDQELLTLAGYVVDTTSEDRLTQLEERFDRMEEQLAELLRRLPRRGAAGST